MKFIIKNGVLKKCKLNKNETDVVIPDGVTEIGDWAFEDCTSLISVTIPDSVTKIGDWAFEYCNSLISVTIPDSVIKIGDGAFKNCESLESVTIPDSIAYIASGAFDNTPFLKKCIQDDMVFGSYFYKYIGNDSTFVIPDGITVIGDSAFKDCTSLTAVTIPDSVTKIGYSAFRDCTSLKSVTIPDSVTEIACRAFEECTSLISVTIPDSVTEIACWAFEDCTSLISVTMPDGVTEIGDCAFSGCRSLQSVVIPNSVTEIGEKAFAGCRSLKSVTIPDSVTKIGEYAFNACENIESFIIAGDKQIIPKYCFGSEFPEKLLPEIMKLISHMNDIAFKQYILTKKIWNSLSDEDRFNFFVTRQGKPLQKAYLDFVSKEQVTDLGSRMLKMFDGTPSATECNAVAALLLLFGVAIDDELIKQLFNSLKNAKNGKKAVDSISKDASILNRCSGEAEKVSEIEKIAAELIKADGLTTIQVENTFTDLYSPIYLPDITDTAGKAVPTYILQYLLCAHVDKNESNWFDEPEIRPELRPLLDMIDPDSFQKALKTIADDYLGLSGKSKKMYLAYPVCRYGSDELIEEYTKKAPKWRSSSSGNDAPPLRTFRNAIMYNNSRAAMLFAEKYQEMDKYAELRGTTADVIRDTILADFGLESDGTKTYDLGSTTITAQLSNEFTISLYDNNAGKVVKSLPKKGSDPALYESASAHLSEMTKNLKKVAKSRNDKLFEAFLKGNSFIAASWKKSYTENPLLRQIASLLVWRQGKTTFTLSESGAVDSSGAVYTIDDSEPIILAHPMEMEESDVKAWQKYFSDKKLKQPFLQVWEPVADAALVKPDRYDGIEIPFNFFRGSVKHGISIEDYDFHNEISIDMPDCAFDVDFTVWHRHELPEKVVIKNFHIEKLTRRNNHIIALLDRWTVAKRIADDDTSIFQFIGNATLAQLTYYIDIAGQNNATNCMAELLELKNKNYPDFDPMDEYSLD